MADKAMAVADAGDVALVRDAAHVWLANSLQESIQNIGYPVGMGIAPDAKTCRRAAWAILDKLATDFGFWPASPNAQPSSGES